MNEEQTFKARINGANCIAVMQQQHWHRGKLSSLSNVIFLQTASESWVRFFFDAGVFFWRNVAAPEAPGSNEDDVYKIVPALGIACISGSAIISVVFQGLNGASIRTLVLGFTQGNHLTLINAADENTILIAKRAQPGVQADVHEKP
jgi:hypothetical protein